MNLLSILLWLPALAVRLVLVLLGLVAVPLSLLGDGQYRTPKMWAWWGDAESVPEWWVEEHGSERLAKFWWMAVRNPTSGLRWFHEQPLVETHPNPDNLVYGHYSKSASRWMRYGLYSEYWYLRAVGRKKFEFRIGWKFADGTPGFLPCVSLRYGY